MSLKTRFKAYDGRHFVIRKFEHNKYKCTNILTRTRLNPLKKYFKKTTQLLIPVQPRAVSENVLVVTEEFLVFTFSPKSVEIGVIFLFVPRKTMRFGLRLPGHSHSVKTTASRSFRVFLNKIIG